MANQVLYGFVDVEHLFAERVNQVGVDVINNAIDQSVEEHNRQLDAIIALFADRTTQFKRRFRTPSVARLQPLDDNGRALPIQAAGQYGIAFPLQSAGSAWGANYVAREKMTVEMANNITSTMLSADVRWIRDHILAGIFANVAWTFADDEHDDLTIEGLANGDTVKYLVKVGQDTGATDTHYLAQAGAVADETDPFPVIYKELTEHPENDGRVLALVPSNVVAAVKDLAGFKPYTDPNLALGANETRLVGTFGVAVPGEMIGYHDARVWIAEWPSLPDNYIVAVMTGGPRALGMREDPEDSLKGFKRVAERNDHPFYESQWLRRCGFGGQNRVNALVYRVSNGTYAIPTGYTSPMP